MVITRSQASKLRASSTARSSACLASGEPSKAMSISFDGRRCAPA